MKPKYNTITFYAQMMKTQGFFGEKDCFDVVDSQSYADQLQKACMHLDELGYEVISVTPLITGKLSHSQKAPFGVSVTQGGAVLGKIKN